MGISLSRKNIAENIEIADAGDYYAGTDVEAVLQEIGRVAYCVPLATSGDYTIPTGHAFIGGDEYSVEGMDTLNIEGTGRMILVG